MSGEYGRNMEEKLYTGFWRGNLKEGDYLKDIGIDGKTVLRWTLKEQDGRRETGRICLRIGKSSGLY
jgi:hypothetical protein